MDRLFTLLVTMCVAAAAAFAWDRHPPIGFDLPIPFISWRIELPKSLAQERDEAILASGLDQKRARACGEKLDVQSAKLEGLQEETLRATKAAEQALTTALRGRAAADAAVARLITRPPVGIDACARMQSADEAALEALG